MLLFLVLALSVFINGDPQFSELAKAFAHGQLNFLTPIGKTSQDPILYKGKIFWSDGPLPAIILIPFVAFFDQLHIFFYQGYLQWLLILGVVYIIYRLARHFDYSVYDSIILILGFVLGSVFIGVAALSASWYYAQVLTTLLLFWGLIEYFTHKITRWWLLGIICGLLLMTRATAAAIFVFFWLEAWQVQAKDKNHQRLKRFTVLLVPVLISALLLLLYNYMRFGNPLNGGYAFQLLEHKSALSRSLGVFSPVHIPTNLFSAVLRGPVAVLKSSQSFTLIFPYFTNNIYGMSLFITSPYLLQLFTNSWSSLDRTSRHLLMAIALCALAVFSFYGIGQRQFGYRYSLDFLPLVFVLLIILYKRQHQSLTRGMKFLLIGSGIFNFYLLIPYLFNLK